MGSVGLWVGLGPGSKFSLWYGLGWVGLGWSFGGLGWVEQIGSTDNSAQMYRQIPFLCCLSGMAAELTHI